MDEREKKAESYALADQKQLIQKEGGVHSQQIILLSSAVWVSMVYAGITGELAPKRSRGVFV